MQCCCLINLFQPSIKANLWLQWLFPLGLMTIISAEFLRFQFLPITLFLLGGPGQLACSNYHYTPGYTLYIPSHITMGHSVPVSGLSYLPTLAIPLVFGQPDTLLGCRHHSRQVRSCSVRFSIHHCRPRIVMIVRF